MTHIPITRPSECDDFRGFYPLKSITMDKIISSTNDIEKAITDLASLLDSNPDSISSEQAEKLFAESISTVELSLISFLNYIKIQKSPQLRSITANTSKENALFSLFYDYTQLAVKVYNQKIFYNPSFFPFIIFFTNLCCYYIDIFQNPSLNLKKDFQNAWNENYTISTRLQYFYTEVGITPEFNKIERYFDQTEMQKISKISENNLIIYDIHQSLKVLRKDMRAYEKEENFPVLIQNIIIDLETLRTNFVDLRNLSADSDQQIVTEKLNAINSLITCLESCASYYKLYEMAIRLNIFIRNDVFVLPNEIVKSDYNNWICFRLAMQAIQLNLKIFISIRYTLNEVDLKAINCYKLLKKIMLSIDNSTDDPKMGEMISQFLEDMKLVKPLNDDLIYQRFVSFYEEQVDNMLKNFDEKLKEYTNRVKSYFDNFKSYSKKFEGKKDLITATNRFNFFSNFEDCYRSLLKLPQGNLLKIDEGLFKLKFYLDMNIIYYSNQNILNYIQNLYRNLSGNPEIYNSIEKRRNLKSTWNTMLNLINSIYSDNEEPKDSEIFLCFFRLFLKISLAVLDLNEKEKNDKYEKLISYILKSFPKTERLRSLIPVQERIDDLRMSISQIQTEIVKVVDIVFPQSDKRGAAPLSTINDSSDIFLVKFFECEGGITKISQTLSQLETTRKCIQFFTIYESFASQFDLESYLPTSRQASPIITTLYESFPHFVNGLIFMIKSTYLNINITPSFMKKLVGFIRLLITNESLNRRESFTKIINEVPFIDYSSLFRIALINFLKIDSLVRKTLITQKNLNANESELVIQSIIEKEKKYNEESYQLKKCISNIVASFKIENSVYDYGSSNFISAVLQISSDLYRKIQKYWNRLLLIFRFNEKFDLFIASTKNIRNDLQIEKKEFPKRLNQYINLMLTISQSLNIVNKSSYISNELRITISEFNSKLNEARSIFKFLFYDDVKQLEERIFIPLLLKMEDLENDLQQTNIVQFTNTIRSIMAKFLPVIAASSSDQNYTRCEEVISDVLHLIDILESDTNDSKFGLLFEIKQKVKQFKNYQEPLFTEFYNALKKEINCEMNLSFIKSLIVIHNMFLLQIAAESHNLIEILTVNSTSLHQILHLPAICQIPEISRKFESIINKINSKKKSKSDDDKDDSEKDEILSKLASELLNAKMNAEFHVQKIIDPTGIGMAEIAKCNNKTANYKKLVSLYKEKLDLLAQLREETRQIKGDMNDRLGQIQIQIAEVNQEGFKLKFDLKKFADIEKAQVEYFNKPALDNLQWAKKFLTFLVPKTAERRKIIGKSMNPVLPVIHSDIQKENPLPKNAKVSYSMIIEIEQRFQKAVEKNKNLWDKAKSFTKTNKNDENEVKVVESVKQPPKNDSSVGFKECQALVKNGEIVKEFKANVETVYELFSRSSFLQQILFSKDNGEYEALGISSSNSSGNIGNSSSSSYSSGSSSGSISSSFSSGGSGIQLGSGGNSNYDEEEIMDMLDAFNNELFDRSMNFYFINKILQRKNEKKSRRKIKVKKHRKSVLRDILDDEIKNQ